MTQLSIINNLKTKYFWKLIKAFSQLSLVFVLIFMIAISSFSQRNKAIDVRVVYEKGENERILIGDHLKLVAIVLHNIGEEFQLKLDKDKLKAFEIVGDPIKQTQILDGFVARTQIEVKLIAFQTGKISIPPLVAVSNYSEELQSSPLEIEVQALTKAEEKQIKDIKLIQSAPNNGWLEPLFISLLMTATAFYLTFRLLDPYFNRLVMAYWQRFFPPQVNNELQAILKKESLEDEIINKLKALLETDLIYRDIKAFHVELAEIMLSYAVKRYGVENQEYTSTELLALFEQKSVPNIIKNTFEQILTNCDLVKFAQFQVEINITKQNINRAIDLFKSLNYRAK
jgi:hypothetical protein